MKKRFLSVLLALAMALSLIPAGFAASAGGTRSSGSTAMSKLTQREIAQLLSDNPLTLPSNLFDAEPSTVNPYVPGKVKDEALQAAANRLNALRRIAGLPPVTLDAKLCEDAQYGAVLLAASSFSHTPAQPTDMDDKFYQTALSATSSSNIHMYGTTGSAVNGLTDACDGFMDDSDASNVSRLGHRRWQLNPVMGKVGFGYVHAKPAGSSWNYQYTTEKVFDKSGAGCDYDFIGWPASGNFPSSQFGKDVAWSVTLNPAQYQAPSQSDLTVTLKRESDGKTWTFSGTNYTAASSGAYFHVDTGAYGVANCIIFRPEDITSYEGVYTVKINGLKTKSGQTVTDFTYQVDFFDVNAVTAEMPSFTDVIPDWCSDAVNWAVGQEVTTGYEDNTFRPGVPCTHAQILTFLWRAAGRREAGIKTPVANVSEADYFYWAVLWANDMGMIDPGAFDPDRPCTRSQAVFYICQAFAVPYLSPVDSGFTDVPAGADYAYAVAWAVENGVTNGYGDAFRPDEVCTRGQIATFLHRAYVPSARLK